MVSHLCTIMLNDYQLLHGAYEHCVGCLRAARVTCAVSSMSRDSIAQPGACAYDQVHKTLKVKDMVTTMCTTNDVDVNEEPSCVSVALPKEARMPCCHPRCHNSHLQRRWSSTIPPGAMWMEAQPLPNALSQHLSCLAWSMACNASLHRQATATPALHTTVSCPQQTVVDFATYLRPNWTKKYNGACQHPVVLHASYDATLCDLDRMPPLIASAHILFFSSRYLAWYMY
eukprot:4741160-Amphidinium_carterae.1